MNKRYIVLVALVALRFALGYIETLKYTEGAQIKVKGTVNKIYQKNNKCIYGTGRFLIEKEGICEYRISQKINTVGSIDRQLIDNLIGKIRLVTREIDLVGENSKTQELKEEKLDRLNNFREELVSKYKQFVPEPEAGLVAGIVLGYKKDIGRDFYDQMVKSGSVHIAVASGYNILLVGGFVLSLFFWFCRRFWATWIAIIAMIFYAVLAGGEPPVIRAVGMAGFIYLAQLMGRSSISTWILCLTAVSMLIWEPALIADISFQLSVAASWGMVVLDPLIKRWLSLRLNENTVEKISSLSVVTTVATMIATLPIIWFNFGRVSLIGIVSNILILPVIPPLMILASLMLLLPFVFAGPVYALSHLLVILIQFFGK